MHKTIGDRPEPAKTFYRIREIIEQFFRLDPYPRMRATPYPQHPFEG